MGRRARGRPGYSNWTFLNGARVQAPTRLKDGDVLGLEVSVLTVSTIPASGGTTS